LEEIKQRLWKTAQQLHKDQWRFVEIDQRMSKDFRKTVGDCAKIDGDIVTIVQ
jgi:hypothetical protein